MVRILIGGKLDEVDRLVELLGSIQGLDIVNNQLVNLRPHTYYFDPATAPRLKGTRRLEVQIIYGNPAQPEGRKQP